MDSPRGFYGLIGGVQSEPKMYQDFDKKSNAGELSNQESVHNHFSGGEAKWAVGCTSDAQCVQPKNSQEDFIWPAVVPCCADIEGIVCRMACVFFF